MNKVNPLCLMRIADNLCHGEHTLQPGLIRTATLLLEQGSSGKEEVYGLFVSHQYATRSKVEK